VAAGAGAAAEPGVDIVLGALVELSPPVCQPLEELDGEGRVLLGA
jgi:hypothetical protein